MSNFINSQMDAIDSHGFKPGVANPVFNDNQSASLDTTRSLARYLNKSVRTIEAWRKRGYLPHLKVGRSVMFIRADVIASLRERFGMGPKTNQ